jgi:hypothetical protein
VKGHPDDIDLSDVAEPVAALDDVDAVAQWLVRLFAGPGSWAKMSEELRDGWRLCAAKFAEGALEQYAEALKRQG